MNMWPMTRHPPERVVESVASITEKRERELSSVACRCDYLIVRSYKHVTDGSISTRKSGRVGGVEPELDAQAARQPAWGHLLRPDMHSEDDSWAQKSST